MVSPNPNVPMRILFFPPMSTVSFVGYSCATCGTRACRCFCEVGSGKASSSAGTTHICPQ
eukprot:4959902-Karenia_brevis.AAC.1